MFSLSCTVSGVNISRLAFVPACLMLASCSGLGALGPHPNKEILGLAQQAEADARSLADAPAASQLRSTQAGELYDEIARLCGTDDAGAPPESCSVDRDTGGAVGAADEKSMARDVPAAAARAASSLPRESVDLVVAQAVDAAALEPVELPGSHLSVSSDLDAAREMLRREYALDYALELAASYGDADTAARVNSLREASDERVRYLTELLGASGNVPLPSPGYEVSPADDPVDAGSAAHLVDDANSALVAQWRRAAASAASPEWMRAAVALAAHAQRV